MRFIKEIIIRHCGECPNVHLSDPIDERGGIFLCEVLEREIDSFEMVMTQSFMPHWCPLENFGDYIKILIAQEKAQRGK